MELHLWVHMLGYPNKYLTTRVHYSPDNISAVMLLQGRVRVLSSGIAPISLHGFVYSLQKKLKD